ncbi:MAG: hypothetical protein LBK18_00280 [Prevotellaceae bacterium]|nr:hypothetical protein [Prevotellaceae bacterium]
MLKHTVNKVSSPSATLGAGSAGLLVVEMWRTVSLRRYAAIRMLQTPQG